jgi:hypothetical protein
LDQLADNTTKITTTKTTTTTTSTTSTTSTTTTASTTTTTEASTMTTGPNSCEVIHEEETTIKQGQKLATISHVPRFYEFSFEFKITRNRFIYDT